LSLVSDGPIIGAMSDLPGMDSEHGNVPALRVDDLRGHYLMREVRHGYLQGNDVVTLTAIPVLQPDGTWVGKAIAGYNGDASAPAICRYTTDSFPDLHKARQAAMQLARKIGRTYDPAPLVLVRQDQVRDDVDL
jgi:hypothetical protein